MKHKCIIIVQLGTPNSLAPSDLKSYLNEFLMDPGTISIPWILRYILVKWIIVPKRTPKVIDRYKLIWDDHKGSPLAFHTEELTQKLNIKSNQQVDFKYGMLYGSKKIESVLDHTLQEDYEEIIVLPLFPHETPATTEAVYRRVQKFLKKKSPNPKITFLPAFYSDPDFIKLFSDRMVRMDLAKFDSILFSFHGLPLKQTKYKDNTPGVSDYMQACEMTARKIVNESKLDNSRMMVTYQSRFGKNWTGPQTEDVLKQLASEGKSVLIVSPSFTADCLETSWEIGYSFKEQFVNNGGGAFEWIPSLNSDDDWVNVIFGWIQDK